jgi:hypothetical protein
MIVCQSAPPASAPEPRLTAGRCCHWAPRTSWPCRSRPTASGCRRGHRRPARRDLDVLDQLGEQLAALGVDRGLLVLRGRPLGVARHALSSRLDVLARPLHHLDELAAWTPCRRSPRGGRRWPAERPAERPRSYRRLGHLRSARAPRPGPTDSTHGARMKTARTGAGHAAYRSPARRSRPGGRRRCGAP